MNEAASTEQSSFTQVKVRGSTAHIDLPTGPIHLPVESLPSDKIEWIEEGRRRAYDGMLSEGGEAVRCASYHLPMVTTYSAGATFPFNCGNKGVGYLPKEQYLDEFIEYFRCVHESTRGKPWRESLRARVEAARSFYFDRDKIDYRACATLEIFEKTTFANLKRTPLASLLFTGDSPVFTSFQMNTAVEIIDQSDPRHTFVMLMRTLFESEPFHIYQPQFPYAYVFWICEVKDKTPFRVKTQAEKVQYKMEESELRWEEEALEAISRAPTMIQKHIREAIENYASQRGYSVITNELVQEAKEQFMG